MKLFDTHCHLAHAELRAQAATLAERAQAGGLGGLAIIAADEASLEETPRVVSELRASFPALRIVGTAGIHPHDAKHIDENLWARVVAHAEQASAIGETGLDYHYGFSGPSVQRDYFARHIDLACQLRKPLVIHCRNAAADVLELLDTPAVRNHPNPGILHCFTEDATMAEKLIALGFYISFSGILTFKNAEPLRQIAARLPVERLLIETDSPWLAPIPHRGKTNEPAYVARTFDCLASLRSESPDALAQALWENSCRVYGVPATW